GETFLVPEALLTETPKIPGTDNRKMSKSYNNCIYLKDPPDVVKEKISKMFTDPKRIYRKDHGHPKTCPSFIYHKLFNSEGRVGEIEKECKGAIIGCTDCKKELGEVTSLYLKDIQEKRHTMEKNKKMLWDILNNGTEKARKIAKETMIEVKKRVGLIYEEKD
ncbi:MAG: tryptophan--tRNA ligase, partial [Candidatus Omnitrophica bacterium]|nr:tryptophan--tRNA ligase [Candidatus Omnitrophota bacterium]